MTPEVQAAIERVREHIARRSSSRVVTVMPREAPRFPTTSELRLLCDTIARLDAELTRRDMMADLLESKRLDNESARAEVEQLKRERDDFRALTDDMQRTIESLRQQLKELGHES